MRDEEYLYYQDVREKKHTGYSARKQRTHCGKAGCKLPSDYLTKKEKEKMNGECKSYRLNEPMMFHEFKKMPVDLQIAYITAIRAKYNAPTTAMGEMFGVAGNHLGCYLRDKLGFTFPRGHQNWDKDGFWAWVNGIPKQEEPVEVVEVPEEVIEEEIPVIEEEFEFENDETPCMGTSGKQAESESVLQYRKCVPSTGSLTYEGLTFDILSSVADLLGNSKVQLTVQWNVVD